MPSTQLERLRRENVKLWCALVLTVIMGTGYYLVVMFRMYCN